MDIGIISKLSGIAPSAIRYYEEIGLIESIGRVGLRRQFHSNVLQRLALINLGKHAGFNLEEISTMLAPSQKTIQIDRVKLNDKAREIDRKISKLSAIRDCLHHAANCKAANHLECPTFVRLMKLAIRRPLKK